MKKYIYILLIPAFFSCNKQLTEKVYSTITPSNYYQSASDAVTALYGVYNALNRSPNYDWDTWLYSMVFMPSQYVETRVPFRRAYSNFTYGTNDNALTVVWQQGYVTIDRANAVIDRVPAINMSDSLKKEIVAEAKFIRALTYFNLVRLYGGVPLRIHETTALNQVNMPRSTASQVYDLIIADLTEGETNLPDKRPSSETGRATSGAASGLLGKVYLTMAGNPLKQADKWALARTKLKYIIDNKARWGYNLVPNYRDIFSLSNENNQEVMFAIQNSHVTGEGSVLAFFNAPLNSTFATANGQYHYGFTLTFWNLFAPTDTIRRNTTMVYSYVDMNGKTVKYNTPPILNQYKEPNGLALGKFQDGTGAPTNTNHANDVLVLRYADVLLMFAEAENEVNGPTTDAYSAINQVRARAKTTPLVGMTQATFRDAVYQERLFELSGELTEFFDIQRLGKLQQTMANSPEVKLAGTTYDPKYYLYPIPLAEINSNTAIGPGNQNPGW